MIESFLKRLGLTGPEKEADPVVAHPLRMSDIQRIASLLNSDPQRFLNALTQPEIKPAFRQAYASIVNALDISTSTSWQPVDSNEIILSRHKPYSMFSQSKLFDCGFYGQYNSGVKVQIGSDVAVLQAERSYRKRSLGRSRESSIGYSCNYSNKIILNGGVIFLEDHVDSSSILFDPLWKIGQALAFSNVYTDQCAKRLEDAYWLGWTTELGTLWNEHYFPEVDPGLSRSAYKLDTRRVIKSDIEYLANNNPEVVIDMARRCDERCKSEKNKTYDLDSAVLRVCKFHFVGITRTMWVDGRLSIQE